MLTERTVCPNPTNFGASLAFRGAVKCTALAVALKGRSEKTWDASAAMPSSGKSMQGLLCSGGFGGRLSHRAVRLHQGHPGSAYQLMQKTPEQPHSMQNARHTGRVSSAKAGITYKRNTRTRELQRPLSGMCCSNLR